MYSAELREKVQRCYFELMSTIRRVGGSLQGDLIVTPRFVKEDYIINGMHASAQEMIRALSAYAFRRPVDHGITLFLDWNTETGQQRIRAAIEEALAFLRSIPYSTPNEHTIDGEVWGFLGRLDCKSADGTDLSSRIQVLQTPEQAEMGRMNCHGMGSCGR